MARRRATPLPIMLAELGVAAWETIAHRTLRMALGTMSAAEYRRMFSEKIVATQRATLAALTAKDPHPGGRCSRRSTGPLARTPSGCGGASKARLRPIRS